jgi:hypothetical protein
MGHLAGKATTQTRAIPRWGFILSMVLLLVIVIVVVRSCGL